MANVPKPKLPEEIVVAYERILQEAVASDVNRRKELLADSHSPLGRYLLAYADAKQKTNGKQRRDTVIETYELMLELVKVSPDLQADAYDSFSPLGDTFEEYCEAVIESGDKKKVTSLIQIYEPYLDHNLGYGRLGTAAYRIGDYATAERFFLKLRELYDNYERSDQMGYLAEIWLKKGKSKEAQQLLLECLRRLADDAKAATGSDRNLYEEWFQSQRKTYLRLFPEGSQDLAKTGIPDSTKN